METNSTLRILNFSDPKDSLVPDLGSKSPSPLPVISLDDIPTQGPVILYIIGHGRQNMLMTASGGTIEERDLARKIQSRREGDACPTLLIWDVCFAETMREIDGKLWPPNFVHIFSCRKFERTWRNQKPATGGPSVTVFSTELRTAVSELKSTFKWDELQKELRSHLYRPVQKGEVTWALQVPSVDPLDSKHQPSDFGLGELIGRDARPLVDASSALRSTDAEPSGALTTNLRSDAGSDALVVPPPSARYRGRHGAELRGLEQAPANRDQEARFGKMFPDLKAADHLPPPTQLGRAKGPMDGGLERNNSSTLFALLTYFGQFVDHDCTFDATSSFEQQKDASARRNFRTPLLELDSLYGAGPQANRFLYDRNLPDKMLLGRASNDDAEIDVPRNSQGAATIADPRNDDNLIISQLHVAFIKFHNAIVDKLNRGQVDIEVDGDRTTFAKAQCLVRWHYQWLIFNHFLPAIVGSRDIVLDAYKAPKLFQSNTPFIPIEFSVAAYRFGHTMVQPRYVINDRFRAALFPASSVPPASPSQPRQDLRGGPLRIQESINWRKFFDPGAPVSSDPEITPFASKIDTHLAGPLLDLPDSIVGKGASPEARSLAIRNLKKSADLGLPSGQDVAARVKRLVPSLKPMDDNAIWAAAPEFKDCAAPLWYYSLREAEEVGKGEHLGPVGGRIVAEVLTGLLKLDDSSYLSRSPDWKPVLGAKPGDFTFIDFFREAGVDYR